MASKQVARASACSSSFLIRHAVYVPLGIATVYVTFFVALLTPLFQRHFIFLHAIQFPFFPSYDKPAKYGLAPFKTRALKLSTNDGETIGAWHVLPEVYYQRLASLDVSEWRQEVYQQAMVEYPTILYLHGNSMNRAAPFRIGAYQTLTGRIDANVVAIDYRGFGDSTGTPSEQGLVEDAESAYRWIRHEQRGAAQSVVVFGQSLGTGIGALLATKLERQRQSVDGLVLMAAYTDIKSLVKDFSLAGLVPLLRPIAWIPFNNLILDRFLKTHLSTITTLPHLLNASSTHHTSIVLLHARDDPVIPITHSHRLFRTMLRASATPANENITLHSRTIPDYAYIQHFHLSAQQTVTFIQTHFGGHNHLTEGALDLVRLALRLPSHLTTPE